MLFEEVQILSLVESTTKVFVVVVVIGGFSFYMVCLEKINILISHSFFFLCKMLSIYYNVWFIVIYFKDWGK